LYVPPDPRYTYYVDRYTPTAVYGQDQLQQTQPGLSKDVGIEFLFRQNQEVIDSKIHMLYAEMGSRAILKEKNLYSINYDQCGFRNLIYQMCQYSFDRRRVELERKIIDLEQEKRREEKDFFKDLMFLNKELRFAKIEEMEEKQKQALCLDQEAIT
jgi:hypothetical protein